MADRGFCYVARGRECGHIFAASVDKPEYAKDNATFAAEHLRDGCVVERIATDNVVLGMCAICCPKAWKREQERLAAHAQTSLLPELVRASLLKGNG